ncbi:MAG TPA: L-seryl-tRNA(Sec) selenium transferase [Gemmatimonadota bacterium]|nr:L-seryl-tRNA(Sec) selenium transferase [Gemmatimonadota bacterium]
MARPATVSPRSRRSWLPAVHRCLESPPGPVRAIAAGARLERAALDRALGAVRRELEERPDRFREETDVVRAVDERWTTELERLLSPALRPLVNATGVVVHTNLGRAPLAPRALDAALDAGGRYTALELDLQEGRRGSRYVHAARFLTLLTGAEDALVVNNNAAALLIAVDTLARDRAAIVSRGELVEIGGGFRIHEILSRTGARLVEVGATNRTHLTDYLRAMDEHEVGAVLKVHRSNFEVAGFVAEVPLDVLCREAGKRGVPVVFDQGTGLIEPLVGGPGIGESTTLGAALAAGAALACGSGDKLLGGPQAGIVCGRRDLLDRVRSNPLLRALRVDKMTLAALEATLRLLLDDPASIPVRRMLEARPEDLAERAERLRTMLAPSVREATEVRPHAGRAGGGTLPERDLPGHALRVTGAGWTADALARALRAGDPPVVARVADEAVWIDVRTLLPGEEEVVARRLEQILGPGPTQDRQGAIP